MFSLFLRLTATSLFSIVFFVMKNDFICYSIKTKYRLQIKCIHQTTEQPSKGICCHDPLPVGATLAIRVTQICDRTRPWSFQKVKSKYLTLSFLGYSTTKLLRREFFFNRRKRYVRIQKVISNKKETSGILIQS